MRKGWAGSAKIPALSEEEQHRINIGYRVNAFGRDKSCYIDGDSRLGGFWEPGGPGTDARVQSYYTANGKPYEKTVPVESPPLQFLSRMV